MNDSCYWPKLDYTDVTETVGTRITREALSMLFTRYAFAREFCEGKDVLEVACGSGQGLGFLAGRARWIVGSDYTVTMVRKAKAYYNEAIPLLCLDGHCLPFRDRSFDVLICFEAIYYLSKPENFLQECRRVLRTNGALLVCTVNNEWKDFNPSSLSYRYYSATELKRLMESHGFDVELYAGFRADRSSPSAALLSAAKRLAIRLGIIPKTMRGKEWLKRIFYGDLVPVPSEITESLAPYQKPIPIEAAEPLSSFKTLYAVAKIK